MIAEVLMNHMTWWLVIGLSIGSLAFKVGGLVIVGSRKLPLPLERCLILIPAALLAALVVKDTFSTAHDLSIDARSVGLAVAVVAAWRKAPLIVVVVLAAGATAITRGLN
ncbi:MAG: AzlD domain-containing protein [Ilumatobacteraceae bacterium]